MTAFVCNSCGSLVIVDFLRTPPKVLHPTNVACAARTALLNKTLRLRTYLQNNLRVRLGEDPENETYP